jgi:F-type H+-transporting ATPase subunit a
LEGHGTVLFDIFGLRVSSYVTTMWGIMLVLLILSYFATRKMKKIPTGAQNVMESIIEILRNFFSGIMGPRQLKQFFPLLVTLFLFILFSNYSGLLPMAGHLPGLSAPTSTISVTAGLAIVVFFCTHIFGLKEHGLGYFKHFFKPVAFLFPLMIIEELVRPLSLSLRLYGNIFGEEMVTAQLFDMVPFAVPIIMQLLGVMMGLIQAFVFTLLTAVYLGGATADNH